MFSVGNYPVEMYFSRIKFYGTMTVHSMIKNKKIWISAVDTANAKKNNLVNIV